MSKPLCMKVGDWPRIDHDLWATACGPARFLERSRPASKWSLSRRRIAEQAYGQWLAWLERSGTLDPDASPQDRVTPERADGFIAELQDRVSPWSVAMMIGALKRVFDIIAPETDWSWIRPNCADLKLIARPSRNRFAHMVTPRQLFDLGLSMMDEAEPSDAGYSMHVATKARDGLIIAMLICCPVRISNLIQIEIGKHLLWDNDRYRLRFDKDETKTGKEIEADLPSILTPYVEWYIRIHRQALLALGKSGKTDQLWIDRWGKPMAEGAIRTQIEFNTRNAFGRHIWPHLFRAIAVTGLVDEAPEAIGITPDILSHSSIQTTSRHYILASATRAHQRVQASFMEGRAEALRRLGGRGAARVENNRKESIRRIKISRLCRGCADVPAGLPLSGCAVHQAVDNRRWRTGSRIIPKGRKSRGVLPAPSPRLSQDSRSAVVLRTVTSSPSMPPKAFLSPVTKSLCSGSSSPTRSGPSCMAKITESEGR